MTKDIQIDIAAIVREAEQELGRTLPTWKDRIIAINAGLLNQSQVRRLRLMQSIRTNDYSITGDLLSAAGELDSWELDNASEGGGSDEGGEA